MTDIRMGIELEFDTEDNAQGRERRLRHSMRKMVLYSKMLKNFNREMICDKGFP